MTKSEAQTMLDEKLLQDNGRSNRDIYCPDIKNYCRLDCILYVESSGEIAYRHGDRENGWEVNIHNGYCRRHMK